MLTLPPAGAGRACRRDPHAPARTARAAQGRFSGLCAVHQGRSGRRLQRIFRLSRRERAAGRSGARRSRPRTRTRTWSARCRPSSIALLERLSEETARPAAGGARRRSTASQLFGFPAQMARLKQPDPRFPQPDLRADPLPRQRQPARLLFHLGHAGGHADRPADRLAGRSFGAEEVAAAAYSGTGKSFFLHDLIPKVIIGEAAWVSTDRARGAARDDPQGGGAVADRAWSSIGCIAAWLDQLQAATAT